MPTKAKNARNTVQKRKAELLEDNVRDSTNLTQETQEVVKIARQLASNSLHYEEKKRRELQNSFLVKMDEISGRIATVFDQEMQEKNHRTYGKLVQLREAIQEREDLDRQMVDKAQELERLIYFAQKDLNCAIEARMEHLYKLRNNMTGRIKNQGTDKT